MFRSTAAAIAIGLSVWLAAAERGSPAAFAQEVVATELPPLDIVVKTNLKTGDEHVAKYRQALFDDALLRRRGEKNGPITVANADAQESRSEGAARYRLLVEHKGALAAGDLRSGKEAGTVTLVRNGVKTPLGSGTRTFWNMKVTQSGSVNYTFLKWTGKKYQPLSTWSFKISTEDVVTVAYGEPVLDSDKNAVSKCPLTYAEAVKSAFVEALPPDIPWSQQIFARPGPTVSDQVVAAVVRLEKDSSGGKAEISVRNRSPWPIKSAEFLVTVPRQKDLTSNDTLEHFSVKVAAAKLLLPGETGSFSVRLERSRSTAMRPGIVVESVRYSSDGLDKR
jgi:hypothetical protein